MNNKFKNSVRNILIGFGGQLILLALGIVVPRLILVNYGSEINGLTNTITQIYTYIALLEAGIGQSALFALYKAKDREESTKIISATLYEYRKTGKIYAACILVLSAVLPLTLTSELSYITIATITLLSGLPSLISYYTVAAYMQLLTVEGKHYVESTVNLVVTSLSYTAKIVLANLGIDIIVLFFVYALISLLKTIIISCYIRKNYHWINSKGIANKQYFSDRSGYVRTQIAWIIFSNTDIILISFFCGLKTSSVYAVYSLIFTSIYSLMNQIYAGVNFLLGHEYNVSRESYIQLHDAFDNFFDMLICSTMSICVILTLPFIRLYTSGIHDINYIDPFLPLLFCCVQILTWSRYASGNLTSLAGYAKKIGKISIIEAAINLLMTVILVQIWGIKGALIATIIALSFKSNYLLIFANKTILKRSCFTSYKILISNVLLFIVFVFISFKFSPVISNYWSFILYGILMCLFIYPAYYLFNLLVNKKQTLFYSRFIFKKLLKYAHKRYEA